MCADLKLLILDEPTASLTPSEAERLFAVMTSLKQRGVSLLFISHRLEEVRRVADLVTVMRDGEHVITTQAAGLSEEDMVRHMVGRELKSLFVRTPTRIGDRPAFEVRGLSLPGVFEDISFSVRPGEIVGLAGLVGRGPDRDRRGHLRHPAPASGTVVHRTAPRSGRGTPARWSVTGVAYIPENRDDNGLVVDKGVAANICLWCSTGSPAPDCIPHAQRS